MNDQNVLIFKLPELYKILNELKNHLDFKIYSFSEKEELLNSKISINENYLILTDSTNEIKGEKFQLVLNKCLFGPTPIASYQLVPLRRI